MSEGLRCKVCGRKLKSPEAQKRGMGSECAKKYALMQKGGQSAPPSLSAPAPLNPFQGFPRIEGLNVDYQHLSNRQIVIHSVILNESNQNMHIRFFTGVSPQVITIQYDEDKGKLRFQQIDKYGIQEEWLEGSVLDDWQKEDFPFLTPISEDFKTHILPNHEEDERIHSWYVTKIETNNGFRLLYSQDEDEGVILAEDVSYLEAVRLIQELSEDKGIPVFDKSKDQMVDIGVPFIGIIGKDGYTEYYDEITGERNGWHHSHCMTEEGLEQYDRDDTLRFVYYKDIGEISILGEPALDPFESGRGQIKQMVELFRKNGVQDAKIRVEEHNLNTRYENQVIGSLKDF